ncbi:F420-dependent glucose-6-phosphate dehydrogenase [Mycobacterium tuberculosis]|nr:F420-dependent glucose-6-phosphate dehydrogenase [Mycobacterium tuberculosis]
MAELKLGYKASAEQFAPRELVELAVAAEAHGMDSATVSDHFQPWRHQGGHAPFSLSWMTAVGERTNRLLLGTSVLTPTFRYNPAVIAQAFATMGCLYPNRVFLGVGTGEALNEIATGYEGAWPEFKERFARLRESVGLMRQLWSGDRVDFDGDYYRLKGASIYDVPDGGVPVYIAAGGGSRSVGAKAPVQSSTYPSAILVRRGRSPRSQPSRRNLGARSDWKSSRNRRWSCPGA